jgi:hypothetical protein
LAAVILRTDEWAPGSTKIDAKALLASVRPERFEVATVWRLKTG